MAKSMIMIANTFSALNTCLLRIELQVAASCCQSDSILPLEIYYSLVPISLHHSQRDFQRNAGLLVLTLQ